MAFSQIMTTYLATGTHAARPVTPNVASGVTCVYYETDTTNTFVWTGSAWSNIQGTSTPPAELGYVQVTTPQTSIPSSVTDLTSMTLTVTVGTRAIMVEAYIPLFDVTGATSGRMQLQIIDVTASNAVIAVVYTPTTATNEGGSGVAKIRVAPSAGSRTYKLAAECDNGTTGRAFCSSTQPMWLRIYEV